jgi:uncharacterized protein (DUF952 family)
MAIIYHITPMQDWLSAQSKGKYESFSLNEEGLIHCCEAKQIPGILQRYFQGRKDLVKLTIDTTKLNSQLVYDWSPSLEDTFPHIYGPINIDAVVESEPIAAI